MRSLKLSIQSWQKRVIKHPKNLLLHLSPLQLLPNGQRFPVDDFHGVEALREPHDRVSNLAEVDVAEISASETAEEAEVVKPDTAASRATEALHRLVGGLVGLVGLVGGEGSRGGDVGDCGRD